MELFSVLENISAAIDQAGQGAASNLVDGDFSKRILMVVTGLELAWCMGLAMLESDELAEAISRIIRTLFISFLCLMAITNWSFVAKDISQTSQAVVQQIGRGKELGGIVAGTLEQAMRFSKVDEIYSSTKTETEDKNGGWLSKMFSDLSFGTILDKGLSLVLQLGNGGIVTIVAAIAIFIIVLGKVALWVGVIFGPMCLSFAPWKPTRKIAESWASFTFAAMMFPAVAATVLILSGGIFDALAAMAQKAGSTALPTATYSLASLAIAIVAGLVMLQVPRITQALFGSGLGVETPHLPKPSPKSNSNNK